MECCILKGWKKRLTISYPSLQQEVFRCYKRKAKQYGLLHPKCGSVNVVQRFGSALNLNFYFHCLMMDGVYGVDPKTKTIGFHRFGKMTTKDVEDLVVRIATTNR